MRQPGMLVLLAEGPTGDAVAELLRAGHLGLDGSVLGVALAQGGAAAMVAQRLAAQCDAVVGCAPPPLAALLRDLRRPRYASTGLVPMAWPGPEAAWLPWRDGGVLLAASRVLDR